MADLFLVDGAPYEERYACISGELAERVAAAVKGKGCTIVGFVEAAVRRGLAHPEETIELAGKLKKGGA